MSRAEPLIGLSVVVAFGLALSLGLSGRPPQDLSLAVEGPRAHVLLVPPEHRYDVRPPDLISRVETRQGEGRSAVELLTKRVVYGSRWEREVTLPVVRGPLSPEGEPWPCALKLRLLPSFFDDGKPGGGDVVEILDHQIRARFPQDIEVGDVKMLRFAEVRSTKLALTPLEGRLLATGTIVLDDHADTPTTFTFTGSLSLTEVEGNVRVALDQLAIGWTGHTRGALLVSAVDLVADVEKVAEALLKKQIGEALELISLPRRSLRLEDLAFGAPEAPLAGTFAMRLCNTPQVSPRGVILEIAATVSLEGKRTDPVILGPPLVRGGKHLTLPDPDPVDTDHNVDAVVGAEAIQQTLYLLWQSGLFDAWGRRADVLASFRAELADRLTLELEHLDLRLPPVVVGAHPRCDGFALRFADVAIGHLSDGRTAVAHADVCATPSVRDGRLELTATLLSAGLNCVRFAAGTHLEPCLSDVVPLLKERIAERRPSFPLSLPIPERLFHVSLVQGGSLSLAGFSASTAGELMHVRALAMSSPLPRP